MQNDSKTQLLLVVICLALFWILARRSGPSTATVYAGPVQRWDYKIYERTWTFPKAPPGQPIFANFDLNNRCYEDGTSIPCDPSGKHQNLDRLGAEGWELVAVEPRALVGGGLAGVTNEQMYFFRRPKP